MGGTASERPASQGRGSGTITHRELALAALAACLLALVMHWPLPLHMGRDVPAAVDDPLAEAWQIAWAGHALVHQPLELFQANTFWPQQDSLAFSDALVGYSPAGLIGDGQRAALVRYNLLFLFAYALAFLGAYLLARELGCGPLGATVGGAAFAYAPWRLAQDAHLHVLSSGGIPLSLFLLVRGYRRKEARTLLAGWIVAAWHVLLGFTLGLQLLYLFALLGIVGIVIWLRRRPPLGRPVLVAGLAGAVLLGTVAVLLAQPYLRVLDEHPEARRTLGQVAHLSPQLRSYLAAPQGSMVWGDPTSSIRDDLSFAPEQTLFPGLAVLALAAAGLSSAAYSRRLRMWLAIGAIACATLALGVDEEGAAIPIQPYRLLYEYAPGWDGVRTPGRINTLTSLALALLAGAGAHRIKVATGSRQAPATARRIGLAVGAAAVAAVLLEGAGFGISTRGEVVAAPRHPKVPFAPPGQRGALAPQLHLPFDGQEVNRYVFWSTDGFPRMMNGSASFEPRFSARVRARVRHFPDRRSVAWLRAAGVRTVILHPRAARGTAWAGTATRDISGLPLVREPRRGVILYRLAG